MLNLALSIASRSKAVSHLIGSLQRVDDCAANLVRVLTYHRVDRRDATPDLDPDLISATPEMFAEQMKYLASHYHVISMPEFLDAYRAGRRLPPRAVLVTFDDAYQDFECHAWPVLKAYRLPVTLFVATDYPDRPEKTFWWDRLYQAIHRAKSPIDLGRPFGRLCTDDAKARHRIFRQIKNWVKSLANDEAMKWVNRACAELGDCSAKNHVLGWHALRRLASEGVTLAAHSQTHPLMNRISPSVARTEASGSMRDIEREIGVALPVFAYPSGGFNDSVVELLDDEGFSLAFTTMRGINDIQHSDPLRLRRINIGARTSEQVFKAQLLTWFVHLNRWT